MQRLPWLVEIVVLFGIFALLMLGPRRHGHTQSPTAIKVKIAFLLVVAVVVGVSWAVRDIVGPIAQP